MINAKAILDDSNITSQQINEVAEWLEDLSFEQLQFLKSSYEAWLKVHAMECNQEYVN